VTSISSPGCCTRTWWRGTVRQVVFVDVRDGRIGGIYVIMNPRKLGRIPD
jgi:hypothetical protein